MNQTGQIFSDVWSDFRRIWPKLLAADTLCKLAAVVLLTPMVGLALRAFLSISGNSVLADQDILLFVMSPIGVVALVAIAAASLAVVVVEQACLMTIAFGVVRDVRVGVIEALRVAARHLGSILLIAARLVVRVLLLAAPFLAACGLTYAYLLTEFDINFYLTVRRHKPVSLAGASPA